MDGHATTARRAVLGALALVFGGAALHGAQASSSPQMTVELHEAPLAVADPAAAAHAADAVVIARAGAVTGRGVREGTPTTQVQVEVLDTLKGALPATTTVTQIGGPDPRGRHLVLVRGDQLMQPGQTYLLAVVRDATGLLVLPVGGDRLLPGAATSSTPWLDYPAVAAVHAVLGGDAARAMAHLPGRLVADQP